MNIEFVGVITARPESELLPPIAPPAIQPAFISRLAQEYEASPFAAVWIGQSATSADATVLAHAALAATDRLAVVVTLPPSVVDPVTAARAIATLSGFHPGRVQVRLPAGDDRDVEFGQLLKALWGARTPVEHDGRYYTVRGAWSAIRPDPAPRIVARVTADPSHDAEIVTYADTCVIPASQPAVIAARVQRLRRLAGARPIRCAVAVRPIVAEQTDAVRELADRLAKIAPSWAAIADLDEPARSTTHALAAVSGARDGSQPFVGTIEAIAERLAEYCTAGIDQFSLRGFDPDKDIPLHSGVATAVLRRTAPEPSRRLHVHVA